LLHRAGRKTGFTVDAVFSLLKFEMKFNAAIVPIPIIKHYGWNSLPRHVRKLCVASYLRSLKTVNMLRRESRLKNQQVYSECSA
jgi:hypothetical protein